MNDLDRSLSHSPGQIPAVEALVSEHYAYLVRLCHSILGDADEAEDAAQEAIIRAVQNLDRFQPGTSMKNWLSTIAINGCRDLLRRRKTRQTLTHVLQGVLRVTSHVPSPEEAALQGERSQILWQAVRKLDEKHRLPVLLRFVHELPVREIAEILETNEGTVHSRLHYGVRKLQEQLGNLPGFGWTENDLAGGDAQ